MVLTGCFIGSQMPQRIKKITLKLNHMNYFKILFLLGYTLAFGQVGIGTDNLNPNAILELQSANQGLLLPRISDMDRITDDFPAGLLVYDKSKNCISVYNGADWEFLEEVAISTTGTSSTTATTNYVGVGIGTEDPNPDAILELQSNNKGLLLPRIDNLN